MITINTYIYIYCSMMKAGKKAIQHLSKINQKNETDLTYDLTLDPILV